MHPNTFYAKHFNHEKNNEVFVIMSFAQEFESRWVDIIEPCIRQDVGLKPSRVDYNQSGESVVYDILDGIAHAKIVVADITCSMMWETLGKNRWPQRNGNVMWELGIAHTMRLPDEVVTIRSDSEASIFDLTQFRAFQYDPSDVAGARKWLSELIDDRLKTIDRSRSKYVEQCASSLSFDEWSILTEAFGKGKIEHPVAKNLPDAVRHSQTNLAITRLLEMGALSTDYMEITPSLIDSPELDKMHLSKIIAYKPTPLAIDIVKCSGRRIGFENPETAKRLERIAAESAMENSPG